MATDGSAPRTFTLLLDSGLFTSNPTNEGLVPHTVTRTMLGDPRFVLQAPDIVFTEVFDYPDDVDRLDRQFLDCTIAAGHVTIVPTADYAALHARATALVAAHELSGRQAELHGDESARFCRTDALIVETAWAAGACLLTINKRLRTQVDPGPHSLRALLWQGEPRLAMVVLDNIGLTTKEHIYDALCAHADGSVAAHEAAVRDAAAAAAAAAAALAARAMEHIWTFHFAPAIDGPLVRDWLSAQGLPSVPQARIGECIAACRPTVYTLAALTPTELRDALGPDGVLALSVRVQKALRAAVLAQVAA